VIVDNLSVVGLASAPSEHESPPVVDSYGVEALSLALVTTDSDVARFKGEVDPINWACE